jgi:serine/threonine protein kinase
MIKNIGRGAFGTVKLARDEHDKSKFYVSTSTHFKAVKIANKKLLKKRLIGRGKSIWRVLHMEIAIMKQMAHKNVVRLFEVIEDGPEGQLYLIIEYCRNGHLLSQKWKKYQMKRTHRL